MTDSEINIAIAEACGWKWYRRPATGPWAKKPMRCLYHPQIVPETVTALSLADMTERECNWVFIQREGMVPDYVSDLNAMHEAEMTLSDDDCGSHEALADQYALNLLRIVGVWKDEAKSFDASFDWDNHCDADIHRAARATARQRAEAFLRTIGKWRDK